MAGCLIAHTPIAVDYWKKRDTVSKVCFLSHMHSDHTQGLTSSWNQVIFCSEITRSLAIEQLKIQPSLLVAIPIGQSTIIPLDNTGSEKMTVTLIDANHCPGAVMFLFQGYFGCILHTGDFRYFDGMLDIPPFTNGIVVNTLYLDNTYCDPKCEFPTRAEAKGKILEIIHNNPNKDIRFGLDTLGKEDMLCDIAKDQGFPIFVNEFRYKTAELLGFSEYFTLNQEETYIRVERKNAINRSSLTFLNNGISPTIGIIPSALYQGRNNPFANSDTIFVVPYSDHSSFSELKRFVAKLKPQRIIPIVSKKNKDEESHDRADMTIFAEEMSSNAEQRVFDVPSTVQSFMSGNFSGNSNCGGKKRKPSTSYFNSRSKRACGIVFSPKKQVGVRKDEDEMPSEPSITNRSEADVKEMQKGTEATLLSSSTVVNASVHTECRNKTSREKTASPREEAASPREEANIKVMVNAEINATSESLVTAETIFERPTQSNSDVAFKRNCGKNSRESTAPPNQDESNATEDNQGDQDQQSFEQLQASTGAIIKEEIEETSMENHDKNSYEKTSPPNQDKTNAKEDNEGDQTQPPSEQLQASTGVMIKEDMGEASMDHGKNSSERTASPNQDKTNGKDDNQADQAQQHFEQLQASTGVVIREEIEETSMENHGKNCYEKTAPPSQNKPNGQKDKNQDGQTQKSFEKSPVIAETIFPCSVPSSSHETSTKHRGESSQEMTAPSKQVKANTKDDNQTQQFPKKLPVMAEIALPGAVQCSPEETAQQNHNKDSVERAALPNQDMNDVKDENQSEHTQQFSETSVVMVDATLPEAAQSGSGETAKQNSGNRSNERIGPPIQDKTSTKDDNVGDRTQKSSGNSPVVADIHVTLPGVAPSGPEETSKEDCGQSSQERVATPTEQGSANVKEDNQDDHIRKSIDKLIATAQTLLPGASDSILEEKPQKDLNESRQETAALTAEQTRTTVSNDNQDDQMHKCIDKSAVVLEATLLNNSDKRSNGDLKSFAERALDTIMSSYWPRKSNPAEDYGDESLLNLTSTYGCVRQEQTQPGGFQSELEEGKEREEAIPGETDDRIAQICPVSTESIQTQKIPNSVAIIDSVSNVNQNTSDEKNLEPVALPYIREELRSSRQIDIPVLTGMEENKKSLNSAATVPQNFSHNGMPKPVAIRRSDQGMSHGSTGRLSVFLKPTDEQKPANFVPQTESASSKDVEKSCIEKSLQAVSQNGDDNLRSIETEQLPITKQLNTNNGSRTSSHNDLELNMHEPPPILTDLPEKCLSPSCDESDLQLKGIEQSGTISEFPESQGSPEIVSEQRESCISSGKMSVEMHEVTERVLPSKHIVDKTSRQHSDPNCYKADSAFSCLSCPTGNNKNSKTLNNVEKAGNMAQANSKQSSLNTISSAQEVNEAENHTSTLNHGDLKVLNNAESSISLSEANDKKSEVQSVEKEEYPKALQNPGTSISIAGADEKRSTPNEDSSSQEVSESQDSDSDEEDVCLNIKNDTGTYVRIEVDNAVQVTINNTQSPQERSESQIRESIRKEEYASVSNDEETLITVAEGDGEKYNFSKLTNTLENCSWRELNKSKTSQSSEECPNFCGCAGTSRQEIVHNKAVNPHALSNCEISDCFTKIVKPNTTSIHKKVDEPIKMTSIKVPTKSVSTESKTHIEKITSNNVTFAQKLRGCKLYDCHLTIELEDLDQLTERLRSMYGRATGAKKLCQNRALNTVEMSTVEKVRPKRMKRTRKASDESTDNVQGSNEIQEPPEKRRKTKEANSFEETCRKFFECLCSHVAANIRKRSSILGCNCQVEHEKSSPLMERLESADDPQTTYDKAPIPQTPKRQKPSGIYTGDVSFARSVLERWMRENRKDGEDGN